MFNCAFPYKTGYTFEESNWDCIVYNSITTSSSETGKETSINPLVGFGYAKTVSNKLTCVVIVPSHSMAVLTSTKSPWITGTEKLEYVSLTSILKANVIPYSK